MRRMLWMVLISVGLVSCSESGGLPPLEISGELAMRAAEVGSPKAEVLNLLPQGPLEPDTGPSAPLTLRGYPLDRYLIEGSWVEVLWLIPSIGEPETLPYREARIPVIFRDEFFDGWGWAHFDTRGQDWGLAEPVRPVPMEAPSGDEGGAEGSDATGEANGTNEGEPYVREGQARTEDAAT